MATKTCQSVTKALVESNENNIDHREKWITSEYIEKKLDWILMDDQLFYKIQYIPMWGVWNMCILIQLHNCDLKMLSCTDHDWIIVHWMYKYAEGLLMGIDSRMDDTMMNTLKEPRKIVCSSCPQGINQTLASDTSKVGQTVIGWGDLMTRALLGQKNIYYIRETHSLQ